MTHVPLTTHYIERKARSRSLGGAGELVVLSFERARLVDEGGEALAAKVGHVAETRGDHLGFDVLSDETSGAERWVEVKTTKHGGDTPCCVTRNEVMTSGRRASQDQIDRIFSFRAKPPLDPLPGAISATRWLSAARYLAAPQQRRLPASSRTPAIIHLMSAIRPITAARSGWRWRKPSA